MNQTAPAILILDTSLKFFLYTPLYSSDNLSNNSLLNNLAITSFNRYQSISFIINTMNYSALHLILQSILFYVLIITALSQYRSVQWRLQTTVLTTNKHLLTTHLQPEIHQQLAMLTTHLSTLYHPHKRNWLLVRTNLKTFLFALRQTLRITNLQNMLFWCHYPNKLNPLSTV